MSFVAIALIVDIVFLGPLGVRIYGIPVRHVLIASLVVISIVPTIGQRMKMTWQVLLFLGIGLFLVIWGGIVPQTTGVQLKMTLAEVQPIAAIFLILPFYHLLRYNGAEFYLKIARRCIFVMAVIVIIVWFASNVFGNVGVGMAMRKFYISMNDTELGVYIGPLGDGSFRVMLINFIMFPLILCYYNWEDTDLGWSAFYALAIFATGTRAFLGVWALIVGISLLRRRPALAVPLLVVVTGVAFAYMGSMQRLRVFEVGSELGATSVRYLQYFSLMQLFWQYPMFGAGLGANAILIRSVDAPYSYELTYVALLAKLGIVGSGVVVSTLVMWTSYLMKRTQNWTSILSLAAAIFLMTSTNPYLINLVGMTIMAFVIALGAQGDHRRTALLPGRPQP
ncbi:hypothetical protein ACBY01_11690 [Sphingomonas sp. ac-8]|uniref:hypothetical protein n=1 Tax=Sphingomonas sp. ac-8 TaxID=3242977 RepID=UPI003A8046B3